MASNRALRQKMVLTTDAKGATKGFNTATSAAESWSVGLLGGVAASVSFTAAINVMNDRLEKAIAAFVEQEAVLVRLRQRFGENTDAVVAQAEALSKLTGVSSTTINQSQALLGAMGASSEQIDNMALAALNLSSAFNIELTEATRQLGATLSGLQGELGERISALRDLTVEQRKAGEAANVINTLFANAAAEGLSDYEKRLNEIAEAYAAVDIATGEAAVETEEFVKLQERAIETAELHRLVTEGGSGATTAWAAIVQNVKNELNELLLSVDLVTGGLSLYRRIMDEAVAATEQSSEALDRNAQLAERDARVYKEASEDIKEATDLFSSLGVALESDVNKQLEANAVKMETLNELYRKGTIDRHDFERAESELLSENKKLTESISEQSTVIEEEALGSYEALQAALRRIREEAEGATGAIRDNTTAIREGAGEAGEFLQTTIGGGVFTIPLGPQSFEEETRLFRQTFAAGAAQRAEVNLAGHVTP